MRLDFHQEALAEFTKATAYIAAEASAETALRFVDDVERTV